MIHRLLKGLLVFLPTGDHIRVISGNSFFRQEIYVVRQVQPIREPCCFMSLYFLFSWVQVCQLEWNFRYPITDLNNFHVIRYNSTRDNRIMVWIRKYVEGYNTLAHLDM